MPEAYERSAVWYDRIYGDKAYRREAKSVARLIDRCRPGAQTFLEVGCGTGGHLMFLRERLRCEGMDLSESMLAQARDKLPEMRFVRADMRDFDMGKRYDVVASLFSGIGYVRSLAELRAAIACMARHLNPGGLLIVEPWFSREQWSPGIHGGVMVDEPGLKIVRLVVSETRGDFAVTPMHHLVATPKGMEHFVEHHELLLAEPEEYKAAFAAAGLRDVRHDPHVLTRGTWLGLGA